MASSSLLLIILCVGIALLLACALGIGSRREVRPDPYLHPFGDQPGFTAEQLARLAPRPTTDDPLRRSFATRRLGDEFSPSIPAGVPSAGSRAAAAFPIPSRFAAVRTFFRSNNHG